MANTNRANGFRPVKHLTGAPYNGQANIYEIPAGESAPVMVGDFVVLSNSDATDIYPAVERAAASGAVTSAVLVGAVVGFVVDPTNLNTPQYRAANTKRYVYVADAPDLIFEGQEDSVGGSIALASVGLNVGFDATAGSTTTGNSGMQVDSSSVATANTLPLRIHGISSRVDNEAASTNAKILVSINTHQYANGATGV